VVIFLARRTDPRATLALREGLPSWLVYDIVSRGFSRVGYLETLFRDAPAVRDHPELGVARLQDLRTAGIDLGPSYLKALGVGENGGFLWGREPAYLRNGKLVVTELENAAYRCYLRTEGTFPLAEFDRALAVFGLDHTERWPIYLERARRDLLSPSVVAREKEFTLREPLPINLRAPGDPEKSPELKLVESLLQGYLGYLPSEIQADLLRTGCAFVGDMRALLKQFPQLALDQNVLKVNLFCAPSGRSLLNRPARRLLGLEPFDGWIAIRDARGTIETNLAEALKARMESQVRSTRAREATRGERIQFSKMLAEQGLPISFTREGSRGASRRWKAPFTPAGGRPAASPAFTPAAGEDAPSG
jgi:hypothetical protein